MGSAGLPEVTKSSTNITIFFRLQSHHDQLMNGSRGLGVGVTITVMKAQVGVVIKQLTESCKKPKLPKSNTVNW